MTKRWFYGETSRVLGKKHRSAQKKKEGGGKRLELVEPVIVVLVNDNFALVSSAIAGHDDFTRSRGDRGLIRARHVLTS